jgi:predicted TIM-barrel fold metal-dependent hydrolase
MKLITLEEHMTTVRFLASTEPKHKPQGAIAEFLQTMNARLLNVADERIAAMDKAGIDVQVLSLAGAGLNELDATLGIDLATEANDRMAQANQRTPIALLCLCGAPSAGA